MRTVVMVFLVLAANVAYPQSCDERGWRVSDIDPIAQGGRLYDKWWEVCGLEEPKTTHPSYPAGGKQAGSVTWRCKECHGWDYLGKDGAYAKGSHFTGIGGVAGVAGKGEASVLAILKNDDHRFGGKMSDETLRRIAQFVVAGQADSRGRIDPATRKARGSISAGHRLYDRHCAVCHGEDGRALNFSNDARKPEYVGTLAADNPWEALHKIRNGHPGAVMDASRMRKARLRMHHHMVEGRPMPPMREQLSLDEQIDLLSFMQTLPAR